MKYQQHQLQEQQVCEYLTRHPEFFQQHPYVLLELELHAQSHDLPNLALQQLRLLRKQNAQLQNQMASMTRTALENEQVFKQLSHCQRKLWQAKSLSEVAALLQNTFASTPHISATELLCKDTLGNQNTLDTLLEAQSYLGPPPEKLDHVWASAADAQSVALYKLGQQEQPQAILAFASNNPQHFNAANDDLLMQEFIAVLEQRIAAFG